MRRLREGVVLRTIWKQECENFRLADTRLNFDLFDFKNAKSSKALDTTESDSSKR